MNKKSRQQDSAATGTSAGNRTESSPEAAPTDVRPAAKQRENTRRWWIKVCVQPLLFLGGAAVLVMALGVAQRFGFLSTDAAMDAGQTSGDGVQYICPMMCTPPRSEPGRCPVCAMELVPATSGSGDADPRAITVDPAARRVANIQTAAVRAMPLNRTIRAIGELSYDEGTLKTISAYVDGRLERLYADYTGVVVKQGDKLALVYSPRLYSSQVELLLARQARQNSRSASLPRVVESNRDLYESARQRLIELGMTESQIDELERRGEANSRMHLYAPISGTVIEKQAVEGQYVEEGQVIYRLADLSAVWLMLELFPEDAASIRYGHKVEAEVQSLPGWRFTGRVVFVDPHVDRETRTVGVRVVIPNEDGALRIGDYAKATIEVPLAQPPGRPSKVYDPDLADKWISPRHPHVVEATEGKCRICGMDLVPASDFGFTADRGEADSVLVVPREAVLMAGNNSVVYVETDPGRFEIRRVVPGPMSGDRIVMLHGVEKGERVATRGNFLIDSQMQLSGKPSVIDPTKATPGAGDGNHIDAALNELSPLDRALAERQRVCLVSDNRLGSMGTPRRVEVDGVPVFICCEACRASLLETPDKYLAKLTDAEDAERPDGAAPDVDSPPIETPEVLTPERVEQDASPDGRRPANQGRAASDPDWSGGPPDSTSGADPEEAE